MLESIFVFSLNHINQATPPLSRCDDPALHLLNFNSMTHLPLIFIRTAMIVGSNGPEHPKSKTTNLQKYQKLCASVVFLCLSPISG